MEELAVLSIKPADDGIAKFGEIDVPRRLWERTWTALDHLFEASLLARQLGRGTWDFAVGIGTLRQRGLDDNDLRWLITQGWAESGRETHEGASSRQFSHQN